MLSSVQSIKNARNGRQMLVVRGVDDTLCFHYNANGEMIGYTRKTASGETECFLVKNQQGDVEKVIAADGTVLAAYTYDAWGNILTFTGSLANANPIRYRGYYFDSESGLYYVSSRYYDPQVCRFIIADDFANIGANNDFVSTNLFVYCGNNPVCRSDFDGTDWRDVFAVGVTVAIVGLIILAAVPTGGGSLLLASAGGAAAASATAAAVTEAGAAIAWTGSTVAVGALVVSAMQKEPNISNDFQKARNNKQANEWARNVGEKDAESLKEGFVGEKNVSKFNMPKNKTTGEIVLEAIKTKVKIPTDLFLK